MSTGPHTKRCLGDEVSWPKWVNTRQPVQLIRFITLQVLVPHTHPDSIASKMHSAGKLGSRKESIGRVSSYRPPQERIEFYLKLEYSDPMGSIPGSILREEAHRCRAPATRTTWLQSTASALLSCVCFGLFDVGYRYRLIIESTEDLTGKYE